jgi:hypothetical protein
MLCPNCGLEGAVRRRTKIHCPNPGCASYDPDLIPRGSAEDRELTLFERAMAPPLWLRGLVAVVFLVPALLMLAALLTAPHVPKTKLAAAACFVAGTASLVFLPWLRIGRIKRSESAARRKRLRDEAVTGAILFGLVGFFAGGFLVFGLQLAGLRDRRLDLLGNAVAIGAAAWGGMRAYRNARDEEDDESGS